MQGLYNFCLGGDNNISILKGDEMQMKVKQAMSSPVIRIREEESVSVAARTLAHYNVGMLPVCASDGRLTGVITDRDIVTRCLAANRSPEKTPIREIMTAQVLSAQPDMELSAAAHMMGRSQIRRLPVVESGRLCGMLSLGDLACREETSLDAADALSEITSNLSSR